MEKIYSACVINTAVRGPRGFALPVLCREFIEI